MKIKDGAVSEVAHARSLMRLPQYFSNYDFEVGGSSTYQQNNSVGESRYHCENYDKDCQKLNRKEDKHPFRRNGSTQRAQSPTRHTDIRRGSQVSQSGACKLSHQIINQVSEDLTRRRELLQKTSFSAKTGWGGERHHQAFSGNPENDSEVPDKNSEEVKKLKPMKLQFWRTKMCPWVLSVGHCRKGAGCRYAHTNQELRPLPDLSKTKMCEMYVQTGDCPDLKLCKYAHSVEELRATTSFSKTKICPMWEQRGCSAGSSCRFAHGEFELRDNVDEGGIAADRSSCVANVSDLEILTSTEEKGKQKMLKKELSQHVSHIQTEYPVPLKTSKGNSNVMDYRAKDISTTWAKLTHRNSNNVPAMHVQQTPSFPEHVDGMRQNLSQLMGTYAMAYNNSPIRQPAVQANVTGHNLSLDANPRHQTFYASSTTKLAGRPQPTLQEAPLSVVPINQIPWENWQGGEEASVVQRLSPVSLGVGNNALVYMSDLQWACHQEASHSRNRPSAHHHHPLGQHQCSPVLPLLNNSMAQGSENNNNSNSYIYAHQSAAGGLGSASWTFQQQQPTINSNSLQPPYSFCHSPIAKVPGYSPTANDFGESGRFVAHLLPSGIFSPMVRSTAQKSFPNPSGMQHLISPSTADRDSAASNVGDDLTDMVDFGPTMDLSQTIQQTTSPIGVHTSAAAAAGSTTFLPTNHHNHQNECSPIGVYQQSQRVPVIQLANAGQLVAWNSVMSPLNHHQNNIVTHPSNVVQQVIPSTDSSALFISQTSLALSRPPSRPCSHQSIPSASFMSISQPCSMSGSSPTAVTPVTLSPMLAAQIQQPAMIQNSFFGGGSSNEVVSTSPVLYTSDIIFTNSSVPKIQLLTTPDPSPTTMHQNEEAFHLSLVESPRSSSTKQQMQQQSATTTTYIGSPMRSSSSMYSSQSSLNVC